MQEKTWVRTHSLTVYLPSSLRQDLLVNLSEHRPLVEQLLQSLPTLFGATRVMECALGAGLDAAYNIMQHIGGKLVLLQVRCWVVRGVRGGQEASRAR